MIYDEKMKQQAFKEQFPSLIGKSGDIEYTQENLNSFYSDVVIKENCLDKQRVKEAIEKIDKDNNYQTLLLKALKKELGLE